MKGKNNAKMTRNEKIAAARAAKSSSPAPEAAQRAPTQTVPEVPSPAADALQTPAPVAAPPPTLAEMVKAQAGKAEVITLTESYPTFTDEAQRWMKDPKSIPGLGYAPYRIIGWRICDQVANAHGKSIPLAMAQEIVKADGPMVECPTTGKKFQPVKYWAFPPDSLLEDIAAGKPYAEIPKYYGGVHFLNERHRTLVAFSGSRFEFNGIDLSMSSPLVMAAEAVAKNSNKLRKTKKRFVWGNSRDHLETYLRQRVENKAEKQREFLRRRDAVNLALGFDIPERFQPKPLKNELQGIEKIQIE